MKIANIYPICNQKHYKDEQYVMILAHLLKLKLYSPRYFNKNQYIILDNGLYENSKISNNIQELIDLAKDSNLPINEIIIPDVMFKTNDTIQLFLDNVDTMCKNKQFSYMFVAQHNSLDDLKNMFEFIKGIDLDVQLTIGIPKKSPVGRTNPEVIELYKQCKYPIHFLGLTSSFKELEPVKDIIRGVDTSQLANIAYFHPYLYQTMNINEYERSPKESLDLQFDMCDEYILDDVIEKYNQELKGE